MVCFRCAAPVDPVVGASSPEIITIGIEHTDCFPTVGLLLLSDAKSIIHVASALKGVTFLSGSPLLLVIN